MGYHQQKGLDYEHELANAVYKLSDRKLIPIRAGYSGNSLPPMPDIHLDDGEVVHALEVKRTSDDTSFTFQDEDLLELQRFATQYPRVVYPYVGIRFTHRQLCLVPLWTGKGNHGLHELIDNAVTLCPIDAKRSHADNLVIRRPSSDQWISAQSGDDAKHVLETIGSVKGERYSSN